MKVLTFIIFILLVLNIYDIYCHEISYLDYCSDGRMPEPFPISGEKSSGSITMSKSPENGTWYPSNINCSVIFKTEGNHFLLLTFSNVSLRNSSMDNLTIDYNGGKSSSVLSGQQVCSNENCIGLKFDSGAFNNLTLKFLSSNVTVPQDVTGFKAHYTVYDLVEKNGACKDNNQFLCENGHCIWSELLCDDHNNCEDRSDETKCIIPVSDTIWGIIVIVIAILCVLILVPIFCCIALNGTRNPVKSVTVANQLPTPLLPTTDCIIPVPDTIWGIVVIVIAILCVLIFVPMFCCLALNGTKNPVKSVTVANQLPTPLLPTADCGETTGLLTSSDMVTSCWPGTSYDRSNSFSYGTSHQPEPSSNDETKRYRSMSEAREQKGPKLF